MTLALHDMWRSLRAAPIFAFYVLATLVVAGQVTDEGTSPSGSPHDPSRFNH